MRNYKRLFALLIVALMCALLVCGCGKSELKGKRVDCGSYSVIVPEGWTNSESDDGTIIMYRSGDTSKSVFITVDSDTELGYNDIKQLASSLGDPVDDITLDGVKCAGYKASSEDGRFVMYMGDMKNGDSIGVMMLNFTMEDEPVPGIISSFKWK